MGIERDEVIEVIDKVLNDVEFKKDYLRRIAFKEVHEKYPWFDKSQLLTMVREEVDKAMEE